MFGQEHRRSIM